MRVWLWLQRQLSALGVNCHVVCPQKLDERNRRVKTDGLDAKALCLNLDQFVGGNREALALCGWRPRRRSKRALHRQREQLVRTRKQLEAHGRSLLLVNHGFESVNKWRKRRAFPAALGLI